MEIIHTYMSDDHEICVISDNTTIHLADKNDLAVESPGVGTVVRPSQMNEVYLEMPIDVLQEVARRSGIFVEPDPEEEEASSDEKSEDEEEEEEEEEEAVLPPWQPLAREQFFVEYASLDEGVDVNVLMNFPVKVRWEEEEEASWETTDGARDLGDILPSQEGLQRAIESFNQRIKNLVASMDRFAKDQIDIGHEMDDHTIANFLNDELAKSESDRVANAAE